MKLGLARMEALWTNIDPVSDGHSGSAEFDDAAGGRCVLTRKRIITEAVADTTKSPFAFPIDLATVFVEPLSWVGRLQNRLRSHHGVMLFDSLWRFRPPRCSLGIFFEE